MDGQTPDANARLSRLSRETPAFYRWRVPDGVRLVLDLEYLLISFIIGWSLSGYGFFCFVSVETGIKLAPNFSLKNFQATRSIIMNPPILFPLALTILATSISAFSITNPSLDVSPYMSGPTPDGTEEYVMQQTMLRVKDPKKSLDFYCKCLGFKLIHYSEVR